MAKTSMKVKQQRPQKYKVRENSNYAVFASEN